MKTKHNKSRRRFRAGEVIASGGFGCVFRPALKCIDGQRESGKISKLMTKRHAYEEFDEIENNRVLLSKIPNYADYFLVDGFSICEPDKLTTEDLENYDDKCSTLQKDEISVTDINNHLHELAALNMPDGGIDIGDYMNQIQSDNDLVVLNDSLIDLLVNGIIPMNNSNIYHCDIKDSNVLAKKEMGKLYTRLIDWGLSAQYKKGDKIPSSMYRRPFQYNCPFSSILFSDTFDKLYGQFLEQNPEPAEYQLRSFVINYIFKWNEIRGSGHLGVINSIMKELNYNELTEVEGKVKNHMIEYEFTYYYIVKYLTHILKKYTNNGKIDLDDYFNNVYLKNIDVWGFVMIYTSLLDKLADNYKVLTDEQMKIFEKLKFIFIHFLFNNATKPIPVPSLVESLKSLNMLFVPGKNYLRSFGKLGGRKLSKRKTRRVKRH
jgi:serine/threonine protein kinase